MKKKPRKTFIIATLFVFGLIVLLTLAYFYFASGKINTIKVYFFRREKMVAVERALRPDQSPLRQALLSLLAGPNQKEREQGIITQFPFGVKVLGIALKNGIATVNLSARINAYGGGATRVRGMIAQVVYTVTELPGIEKVWIWVEGKSEVTLGSEGLVLDKPLRRNDAGY
jgi:spore germination protein GerM